jgi:hypothetical protein
MLYDLPLPPQDINLLLYADDVIFYISVKRPIDAEIILQPYIDKKPDGAVSGNLNSPHRNTPQWSFPAPKSLAIIRFFFKTAIKYKYLVYMSIISLFL